MEAREGVAFTWSIKASHDFFSTSWRASCKASMLVVAEVTGDGRGELMIFISS
jgi:hypothetical protein